MNAPLKKIGDIVTFTHGVKYNLGDQNPTPPEQILVERVEFLDGQWYYSTHGASHIKFPESAILPE